MLTARWVEENGRVWYNIRPINMSNKRLLLGRKNARMGYSAEYPTGAARCLVLGWMLEIGMRKYSD